MLVLKSVLVPVWLLVLADVLVLVYHELTTGITTANTNTINTLVALIRVGRLPILELK